MRLSIEQAAHQLQSGRVIAVPTETVYGLAASLAHPQAISEIFALKGRPINNPLIVHLANAEEVEEYAGVLPADYFKLAAAFWPGPLTLVLPSIVAKVPSMVRAGLDTTAFRIPSHEMTRQLLRKTGPLVMPSANISGRPSATCMAHVEADFGSHFPVLDGGVCTQGVESTILFWHEGEWKVIRLGALAPDIFLPILGYIPKVTKIESGAHTPLCPGQLYRHYAPRAQLHLTPHFSDVLSGVIIGFDDRIYPKGCELISLGLSTTPETAMQRLYATLRLLDQEGITEAWVDSNFPIKGLWLTLHERLSKAAQK